MDAAFWHQCWQTNQLGFQLAAPHPLLQKYLPALLAQANSYQQIVLPLCGKSPDLMFCRQFLPVQGYELSDIACQDFFREQELAVAVTPRQFGELNYQHYQAIGLQLWQGDFFQLPEQLISSAALFYDRAALIALPPQMREQYARKLQQWLRQGADLLLITLEYPQQERAGPPFSVSELELRCLFPQAELQLLETLDITGQGFGRRRMATSSLQEKIWFIRYKNGA